MRGSELEPEAAALVVSDGDRRRELVLPGSLADLEGWEADDLVAWVADTSRFIGQGERLLDGARLAVGLVLWKLRQEVGDGSYGIRVGELAEQVGVSVRTLSSWRHDAEDHWKLPAPDARTAARREQASGVAAAATPPAVSKGTPERVRPSEVLPPPPGPVTRPAGSASHTAPRGPRHEQLTLPLDEASATIEQVSIEELAALPLARLKGMQARIAQALAIASRTPASSGPGLGCTHAKSMQTVLPYLTRCDPEKGGCGAKVR